jgi:hypothetical protein
MLTAINLIAFLLIVALPLFGGGKNKRVSIKRKQDIEVLSDYSINEDGELEWTDPEHNNHAV